jgi:hypothetical protein
MRLALSQAQRESEHHDQDLAGDLRNFGTAPRKGYNWFSWWFSWLLNMTLQGGRRSQLIVHVFVLPLCLPHGEKGPDPLGSFSGPNCQTYRNTSWQKEISLSHRVNEMFGNQNHQYPYFFVENSIPLGNLPNSSCIVRCSLGFRTPWTYVSDDKRHQTNPRRSLTVQFFFRSIFFHLFSSLLWSSRSPGQISISRTIDTSGGDIGFQYTWNISVRVILRGVLAGKWVDRDHLPGKRENMLRKTNRLKS